jgi:hypothetical protein
LRKEAGSRRSPHNPRQMNERLPHACCDTSWRTPRRRPVQPQLPEMSSDWLVEAFAPALRKLLGGTWASYIKVLNKAPGGDAERGVCPGTAHHLWQGRSGARRSASGRSTILRTRMSDAATSPTVGVVCTPVIRHHGVASSVRRIAHADDRPIASVTFVGAAAPQRIRPGGHQLTASHHIERRLVAVWLSVRWVVPRVEDPIGRSDPPA